MALELYRNRPEFRRHMEDLDQRIFRLHRFSILEKIYDCGRRRIESFDDVRYTHPAIFCIEYAIVQTLAENGIFPDYIVGSSLGESAGLVLAGALTLDEALNAVIAQGQLYHEAAQRGGMMAVIEGLNCYTNNSIIVELGEIASYAYDGCFILSADTAALDVIERELKAQKILTQRLPVLHPFHSSLIDSLQAAFMCTVDGIQLSPLTLPYISTWSANISSNVDHQHFWQAVRNPMKVSSTIAFLERLGGGRYIDVGPSGSFATLTKYNLSRESQSEVYSVLSPFGKDLTTFEKVLTHCM